MMIIKYVTCFLMWVSLNATSIISLLGTIFQVGINRVSFVRNEITIGCGFMSSANFTQKKKKKKSSDSYLITKNSEIDIILHEK